MLMVGLLSLIKLAVVGRDGDFPGDVVDAEEDPVARFESEQLEVHVDDVHPWQVWPASLGPVRRVAEHHRKDGVRLARFALLGT